MTINRWVSCAKPIISGVLCALAFATPAAQASCGSAFCVVNTNWTPQSVWTEAGSSIDLRYEYINQDRPMAGDRRVRVGQIPRDHDEVYTRNQNVFVSLNHRFNANWGMTLVVPGIHRRHLHLENTGSDQIPETADFGQLGDVRWSASYQRAASQDTTRPALAGVIFGVKLPTGRIDIADADGQIAERSLQPGSGTTDLSVGAFYHQKLPQQGGAWFAQTQLSQALNSRAGYKPGAQWGLDAGYTYQLNTRASALLQLNVLVKARDHGAAAEPEDTGGHFIYISPGFSYAIGKTVQLFGFVQLPVYQYVNGVQLTAAGALVGGVSKRF